MNKFIPEYSQQSLPIVNSLPKWVFLRVSTLQWIALGILWQLWKGPQLFGGQKFPLAPILYSELSNKLILERIAFALALLRNLKGLLLDEATSDLDSNSEKVVQVALDVAVIDYRRSRTRPPGMFSYFVKDGPVSEPGTHDHLLLSSMGGYDQLVQLQALGKK